MRGAQKAQPFGYPLDGRVRRQCATNALPSARKEEFIEEQRCFTEDEGRPLGVGLAGAGFKPPQAAAAKIRGGER